MDMYEIRRQNLLRLITMKCEGRPSDLARRIERDPSYVTRMLYPEGKAGKKRIGDDMVVLIENSIPVARGTLDGIIAMDSNSSESVKPAGHIKDASPDNARPLTRAATRLPVISWVEAGAMRDAEDPYPIGHAKEWKDSPFPAGPNAFLLIVEGDSMYSPDGTGYSNGEIIQVEPSLQPTHGKDVIVRSPDGKATFKRYKTGPEGPYLEAINPAWPERIIKVPEGTIICGVVVGSWRGR